MKHCNNKQFLKKHIPLKREFACNYLMHVLPITYFTLLKTFTEIITKFCSESHNDFTILLSLGGDETT